MKLLIKKGGPGSGHRGHAGRPGKRGGSLPGSSVSYTPGGPGIDDPGWGDDDADRFLSEGLPKYNSWENAGFGVRTDVKNDIVAGLAEQTGLNTLQVRTALRTWAQTSNDNNTDALSMQEAAAEELGIELSDWQKEKIAPHNELARLNEKYDFLSSEVLVASEKGDAVVLARLGKDMADVSQEITRVQGEHMIIGTGESSLSRPQERALIRAMYDSTQERFKEIGLNPDDTVSLYRGVKFRSDPGLSDGVVTGFRGNTIESWSQGADSAYEFATGEVGEFATFDMLQAANIGINDHAAVLYMAIPIRNIVASARTGFGVLSEGEFVIMGTIPGQRAHTTVYEPWAPDDEDYGEGYNEGPWSDPDFQG